MVLIGLQQRLELHPGGTNTENLLIVISIEPLSRSCDKYRIMFLFKGVVVKAFKSRAGLQ